jgi:hypothetical protein
VRRRFESCRGRQGFRGLTRFVESVPEGRGRIGPSGAELGEGQVALFPWQRMGVNAQREARIAVSELLRHPPDARAALQRQRRERVPGAMQPKRANAFGLGAPARAPPHALDVPVIRSVAGAEDRLGYLGPAPGEDLATALCEEIEQLRGQASGELDRAGLAVLRRAGLPMRELAPDAGRALLEVHVGPVQAETFAQAGARTEEEVQQRRKRGLVLSGDPEQHLCLLARPGLHLFGLGGDLVLHTPHQLSDSGRGILIHVALSLEQAVDAPQRPQRVADRVRLTTPVEPVGDEGQEVVLPQLAEVPGAEEGNELVLD